MKKFLSIALALLMVCVMLPVVALADDFDTALPAATEGTIKLTKNVKLSSTAVVTDSVTIDLNGLEIINGDGLKGYLLDIKGVVTITNGTIKDSRTNPTGTITSIRNLGTLTLTDMTISRGEGGIAVKNDENGVGNGGTLVVNNSTITGSGARGQAIQNWGTATINSGTFDGQVNAWASADWNAGKTIINGGTFNGDVQSLQWKRTDKDWPTGVADTEINGGTFNGAVAICYRTGEQLTEATPKPENIAEGTIAVTGGTFTNVETQKDIKGFIPEGKTINSNGTVVDKTITIIVPGDTTPAETPKTEDQKNPSTGANDVVAAAVALMAVSALGMAVLTRKK